jgi:TetR/AcrR family transcriptional regulator, tetracycline repressor protein
MKAAENVRNSLTIDTIVDAAIKVIEKEGLAGLSMRQLASTLDVTPTALYHHVKGKDELLDMCAMRIVSQIPVPDRKLPWTKRMRALILHQQQVFMRVPGLAKYLLVHRQSSVAALLWAEAVLGIAHDAGFTPKQATPVLMTMSFLVNPLTLADDHAPPKESTPVLNRNRATTALLKKHAAMFPCLTGVMPHLEGSSYESQFEAALDRVIASIARELAAG